MYLEEKGRFKGKEAVLGIVQEGNRECGCTARRVQPEMHDY